MVHRLRSFGKGKIVFLSTFELGAHGLMAKALAIHVIRVGLISLGSKIFILANHKKLLKQTPFKIT
jgi:hypothetical protein